MNPEQARALIPPFTAAVAETLRQLQALEPLLGRERELLGGRDPEALNAVIREKITVLAQLETAMRGMEDLMQRAGLPGGGAGGDTLVAAAAHPPELVDQWEQLKTLAVEVDRQNSQNGRLTQQAQRGARTALSILTGRQATEGAYDRRGRDKTGLTGYSLGQA